MRPQTALAFAPAVISNFFAIQTDSLSLRPPDFSHAGATGGGFTLSKGVYTHAWVVKSSSRAVSVAVNGNANYPADTTKKAVELLLEAAGGRPHLVELVQTVEVPDKGGLRQQLRLRALRGDGGRRGPRSSPSAGRRSPPSRTRRRSCGTLGWGLSPPPTSSRGRR